MQADQPDFSPSRQTVMSGRGLELPLRPVIDGLPLELKPYLVAEDLADLYFHVPLEKVLAQLSKGCVKISFGELRHYASGVFVDDSSRDQTPVVLPLGEVIARLNPALIERRRAQRHVTVPEDISSPFDKEGQGLVFGFGSSAGGSEAPVAPVNRLNQKPPPPKGPGEVTLPPIPSVASNPALDLPARIALTSAPAPRVPSITEQDAPAQGHGPAHRNGHDTAVVQGQTQPPQQPARPAMAPTTQPVTKALQPQPVKPVAQTLPSAPAIPMPAESTQDPPLLVSITAMAEAWPEGVRREIVERNLVESKMALPFSVIGEALKKGRIAFTWKAVKAWVTPASLSASDSPNDNLIVELPLRVVAPLYLARQQAKAGGQQKVVIDEDIPNLFFGFPQPEHAPGGAAATARPEDTNFYVWDDVAESARVDASDEKKTPTPGTRFVSKYATPNEVVSRAAGLDGVAGALIALPDGLMVASRLPSDVNGDTLAAFLPQIFGKVSQCTKELRMGDLNNLNFTVGNVPWKIFRVNAIFFASFGRSGEPLPTAQLASLAAELDHKPRN
jgi:predicted regulator of Ras-like GTPase activity (Roadblock/LC7/MglB family)